MSDMHDREGMLKGAADILGERLAKATMEILKWEARAINAEARVAELEAALLQIAENTTSFGDALDIAAAVLAKRREG